MKTLKTSAKASKIKLNLTDFTLDKIQNPSSVVGRGVACTTQSECTSGDSGCCDDTHNDDYYRGGCID